MIAGFLHTRAIGTVNASPLTAPGTVGAQDPTVQSGKDGYATKAKAGRGVARPTTARSMNPQAITEPVQGAFAPADRRDT